MAFSIFLVRLFKRIKGQFEEECGVKYFRCGATSWFLFIFSERVRYQDTKMRHYSMFPARKVKWFPTSCTRCTIINRPVF